MKTLKESIIEELYLSYNELYAIFDNNPPLVKARKERGESWEKLLEALSDDQKKLFERYQNAQTEVELINQYAAYSHAMKSGILLMTEVFMKS